MESVYYYYHNAKEFNWFYDTRYNINDQKFTGYRKSK